LWRRIVLIGHNFILSLLQKSDPMETPRVSSGTAMENKRLDGVIIKNRPAKWSTTRLKPPVGPARGGKIVYAGSLKRVVAVHQWHALVLGLAGGLSAPAGLFGVPRIKFARPRGSIADDWRAIGDDIRRSMDKIQISE
jgi:hypothetical protein